MKLKCGIVREDGMVFFRYNKDKEIWVTKQKLEEKLLKRKEFYNKNKEKILKRKKETRSKTRAREYGKIYYKKNFISKKEIWRDRSRKNRESLIHKQKFKRYIREYIFNRRKIDTIFRLKGDLSRIISKACNKIGFKKQSKTADVLGCSFDEFKSHIESQFLPGMTWENRTEWHIDHIMPVSMAKTYDEVVRLNHYKNLRPLWAEENLRKSDKIGDTLVLF